MPEKLNIIVGGMVGQFPLGGVAWDYFHYVLGLAELGHDVVYHEDTGEWPGDPVSGGGQLIGAPYTRQFIQDFFDAYAPHLADRWHFVLSRGESYGMTRAAFDAFAASADVFLNVSGACQIPDVLGRRCVKVFLDTDPGCNQIPLVGHPDSDFGQLIAAHDRHLTYAENIRAADCRVPTLGHDWITTRCIATAAPWDRYIDQPPGADARFTTIMGWDYFHPPLILDGVEYRTKVPEFERFYDVVRRSDQTFKIAVGGAKAPLEQLRKDGWDVVEGRPATLTPAIYADFIGRSRGEWSVAKNVYVDTASGWFSCRTACYLAAGRPAVVQETGWSRFVPSGAGVFAFSTTDEAVAALDQIAADPEKHRRAAVEVWRQYLSPKAVLPKMLEEIFNGPEQAGV